MDKEIETAKVIPNGRLEPVDPSPAVFCIIDDVLKPLSFKEDAQIQSAITELVDQIAIKLAKFLYLGYRYISLVYDVHSDDYYINYRDSNTDYDSNGIVIVSFEKLVTALAEDRNQFCVATKRSIFDDKTNFNGLDMSDPDKNPSVKMDANPVVIDMKLNENEDRNANYMSIYTYLLNTFFPAVYRVIRNNLFCFGRACGTIFMNTFKSHDNLNVIDSTPYQDEMHSYFRLENFLDTAKTLYTDMNASVQFQKTFPLRIDPRNVNGVKLTMKQALSTTSEMIFGVFLNEDGNYSTQTVRADVWIIAEDKKISKMGNHTIIKMIHDDDHSAMPHAPILIIYNEGDAEVKPYISMNIMEMTALILRELMKGYQTLIKEDPNIIGHEFIDILYRSEFMDIKDGFSFARDIPVEEDIDAVYNYAKSSVSKLYEDELTDDED